MIFRWSKMTDLCLKSGSLGRVNVWWRRNLYTRTCQRVWFLILASTCTFSSYIHFLTLQTVICWQAQIINRPRVQKNVNKRRNLMEVFEQYRLYKGEPPGHSSDDNEDTEVDEDGLSPAVLRSRFEGEVSLNKIGSRHCTRAVWS